MGRFLFLVFFLSVVAYASGRGHSGHSGHSGPHAASLGRVGVTSKAEAQAPASTPTQPQAKQASFSSWFFGLFGFKYPARNSTSAKEPYPGDKAAPVSAPAREAEAPEAPAPAPPALAPAALVHPAEAEAVVLAPVPVPVSGPPKVVSALAEPSPSSSVLASQPVAPTPSPPQLAATPAKDFGDAFDAKSEVSARAAKTQRIRASGVTRVLAPESDDDAATPAQVHAESVRSPAASRRAVPTQLGHSASKSEKTQRIRASGVTRTVFPEEEVNDKAELSPTPLGHSASKSEKTQRIRASGVTQTRK